MSRNFYIVTRTVTSIVGPDRRRQTEGEYQLFNDNHELVTTGFGWDEADAREQGLLTAQEYGYDTEMPRG